MAKQLNHEINTIVRLINLTRGILFNFRRIVCYTVFGILISVNGCQKKDTFSYKLFYPNPSVNFKDLEKEGFKGEWADDVPYLRKDKNDTTYVYFYNEDSITSHYIQFKIANIEDTTIVNFIESNPVVLIGDIKNYNNEGKTFVVQNYKNNLFFIGKAIIEDEHSLLTIEYDYPK